MMFTSSQRLGVFATRAALGLVLAVAFAAGMHTAPASARPIAHHGPPAGHHARGVAAASTPAGTQLTLNHRPLSGDYTGGPTAVSRARNGSFDWFAAAVGAAGTLGLVLLLAVSKGGARRDRVDLPLVFEVRDDRPNLS